MKRVITIAVATGALALPASAPARVVELGATTDKAPVSCPKNECQAVGGVSGYQGRSGTAKNPFRITRTGRIVAFSVQLGNPNARQQAFFNNLYGDDPKVRLSIFRKGKKRKSRLDHRLISQSKAFRVSDYFGSTPTFVLGRPLRVRKDYIVGITVPTWIPALSVNLSRSNWWRSSRQKERHCKDVSQNAALETQGRVRKFGCTYFTARLLYTASYVPDPQPTNQKKQ